jgi:RNA polymerase sigma factor (sigma-70 family)
MPETPAATLVDRLRRIARPADPGPDGHLLARFIDSRDPAAFEAIVRRYGPMVLGVCRRVTGNHADADDAFQAAFLVLVHKARTVTGPLLGPWLSAVAYRTAMKARSTAARCRAREGPLPAEVCADEPVDRDDLAGRLDREIQSLPERYRLPVVLCELQGLCYREAAERLGLKEGTLAGRLTRARRMLAQRLRRRGIVVAAAPLTAVVGSVSATVPAALVRNTVAAAGGRVSPAVAALTHGVLTNMLLTKLVPASAIVALVAVLALTTSSDRGHAAPQKGASDKPSAAGSDDPKKIDETLADPIMYHPRVWLELKLTAEQRDEIDRLLDGEETRAQDLLNEIVHAPRADNPQLVAEAAARARQGIMKLPNEIAVSIQTKVLKPEQAKRLRQITLQAKGPAALLREDVRRAMKYSQDQEKRLAEVIEGAWFAIRTSNESASEAYTAAMTKLLDGLTKEQQKAWDDLTGKPFPMPGIVVRKMLSQQAIAAGGLMPGMPRPFGGAPANGNILQPLLPVGAIPPPPTVVEPPAIKDLPIPPKQ